MREIFKHLSIYGVLPVLGKFIGFFLVPIYARVFNSEQFGVLELFVTLVNLLVFTCNLELYTAVGRFFYEYKSTLGKRSLVGTGLMLTIISSCVVCLLYFVFKPIILDKYIGSNIYDEVFILAGIWIPLSAISTYLSVIPRYRKRSKKYVIYTSTSLLLRVISTIFYVLVFKFGLSGILLGHITGESVSLLLYGYDTRSFISLSLNKKVLKKILSYALPIIPGLIIIGVWKPAFNYITKSHIGIDNLGYLSFSFRIIGFLAIFQSAINLTWNPLVFDSLNSKTFKQDFRSVSKMMSITLLYCCIIVILMSNELVDIIGGGNFNESKSIIGILSVGWYSGILARIKGIGPLVNNKTQFISYFDLISFTIAITALIFFGYNLVLVTFSFALYNIVKMVVSISYTSKALSTQLFSKYEFLLLFIVCLLIASQAYQLNIFLRITLSILFMLFGILYIWKNSQRNFISKK